MLSIASKPDDETYALAQEDEREASAARQHSRGRHKSQSNENLKLSDKLSANGDFEDFSIPNNINR